MIPTHALLWPTWRRLSLALLSIGCVLATLTLAGCSDASSTETAGSSLAAPATETVKSNSKAKGKGRPTIPTGGRLEREKLRAKSEAPK